jgi:hypothetical protein
MTTPATQIPFGNPDGSGSLVSDPRLTYDPASGTFITTDSLDSFANAIVSEPGQGVFIQSETEVQLQAGPSGNSVVQISLGGQPGQGIQIEADRDNIVFRSDNATIRLQVKPTAKLSFFEGDLPGKGAAQQTVTGSRASGDALKSLLAALAAYGLIVDNTVP